MNDTTKRILKILLMAVGYFALITAVMFVLALARGEEYRFNFAVSAIGGVLFALITEFFPASRWR